MRYKRRKFGFDQPVIKGTLLAEQSIFSVASPIPIRVLKNVQLWLRLVC